MHVSGTSMQSMSAGICSPRENNLFRNKNEYSVGIVIQRLVKRCHSFQNMSHSSASQFLLQRICSTAKVHVNVVNALSTGH